MTHKEKAVLAQVKKLTAREQLAFLRMLLAYLKLVGLIKRKSSSPVTSRPGRGKKEKKKAYRMTPKRKDALRKAIHANGHMTPATKRKALAKLR